MLHVGEFVTIIFDGDVCGTDAGYPRPADLAGAQRVQQNRKPCEMTWVLWFDAGQRDLVLEFTQMVSRRDDGRADPQHMESRSVVAAVVANLDDVGLANLVE